MSGYAWIPPEPNGSRAPTRRRSRAALGTDGYHELLALSTAEPERFWDAVALDLGVPFETPYEHVLDVSDGPAWARWFTGGRLNLAHACVERWADDPAHAGVEAIVAEDEEGATRSLTYAELAARGRALRRGARVARRPQRRCGRPAHADGARGRRSRTTRWPRSARSSCRSSRDSRPAAVASRLEDSRAVALITVDAFMRGAAGPWPRRRRRTRQLPAYRACARSSSCATPGEPVAWHGGPRRLVARARGGPARARAARHRSRASTRSCSPTPRARPGVPRERCTCTAGSSSRWRARAATRATCSRATASHWMTDIGWIMGPWLLANSHGLGLTAMLYDGAPDYPDARRVWRLAERHRLTFLGVSPTLVRALRQAGDELVDGLDLSPLRLFGSTGEPWNPDPWLWLFEPRRRRDAADHEHLRRHRDRGGVPRLPALSAAQAVHARAAAARHGDGRLRPGRKAAARRGRRARLHAAVARHDARHLGRPRALPRHLLAALPRRLDARRLGVDRRRRRLVPARALRRHAEHRRQAHRPGRVRIGAGRRSGGCRGVRGRRAARGQGRGRLVLLRAAGRAASPARSCAPACASAARRSSARRSRPPRCASPRRCRRRAAPRSCAAQCGRRCSETTPATSRHWRTRARSRRCARPASGARASIRRSRPSGEASSRATRSRAGPKPGTTPRTTRPRRRPRAGTAGVAGRGCSPRRRASPPWAPDPRPHRERSAGRSTVVGQAAETRVCRPGP